MKLADRKNKIEGKTNYIADSLSDTEVDNIHTLTYKVNAKIYLPDGTSEDIQQTLTEKWKVYNEGTDTEYIEVVV